MVTTRSNDGIVSRNWKEKYMEYTFNELNDWLFVSGQELLDHAMTHSSYANEHHLGQTATAMNVWNF